MTAFTSDDEFLAVEALPKHTAAELELLQVAQAVKAYQNRTSPRLSDEAMCRHYIGLGSTKTYRKLCKGDFESLVPENQLPRYRGVLKQLENGSGSDGREEVYEELSPLMDCREAVAGLIRQMGRERFVIIEGPTGAGKTTTLHFIAQLYQGQARLVEAKETWTSLNGMLGDVLVALGLYKEDDSKMPTSKVKREAEINSYLKSNRILLLIDEGHHMTGQCLNVLKGWSNNTPSQIVIASIDTLWNKLTKNAWEEAKQIKLNRLYESVKIAPPSAEDVELFLSRRVKALESLPLGNAALTVANISKSHGWFSYLRRLANRLNAYTDIMTAGVVTSEAEQLQKLIPTR